MNKVKKFAIIGIGLLITIIVALMFVKLHNEKSYWQRQVAEQNYFNWSQVHFMTTAIEKTGFTKDGIAEMYLYINAKVNATETNLSPGFSGGTKTSFFLQTHYQSLALDISRNQEMDAEKLQLAIDIFEEATIELKNLSATILEMAADAGSRLELINTDSELYKQVDNMTKEYSNKYSEIILEFYSNLGN